MAVSNPVIRRYTPPTCTLEILAQNSSLSRWTNKSILKDIYFELRLDDPRTPEDKRSVIRGDGNQLEALCAAVTKYVQELLQTSPDNFWATFSGEQQQQEITDESAESDHGDDTNQSPTKTQVINFANHHPQGNQIYLQPNGHLTHKLFLGSLAQGASTPTVQLSVLQLFDLANALDEYSTDVLVLPQLEKKKSFLGLPSWAPAAAIIVASLGLTPFTVQYVRDRQQQQQTAQTTNAETEAIAPEPNSFGQISPTPNPGLVPPDQLSPISPLTSASPGANPTIPIIPPGAPTANLPSPGSAKPQTQNPQPSQPGQSQSQISIQPNSPANSPASVAKSTAIPSPGSSSSTSSTQSNALTANPQETTARISTPPIPPPNATQLPESPTTSSSASNNADALVSKLRSSGEKQNNVATAGDTLFDTAQVAEARDYLEKRWQPPTALKQSLQYSLTVGADGKIQSIFPLNKPARDYVDRSGLPLIGESFVSPNKQAQTIRIRAVLSPDGKVQTLPEKE